MVVFSAVAQWRGDALKDAAEVLRHSASQYNEVSSELRHLFTEEFAGQAMHAEAVARRALVDDAEDLYKVYDRAANELFSEAIAVDVLAQKARQLQADANSAGYEVSNAGLTPLGSGEANADVDEGELIRRRDLCFREAYAIIASIKATYQVLERMTAPARGQSREILHHGITPPREEWNAEENNDWWTSLSFEEQETIIEKHPDWIGNLWGIPTRVRDRANRRRLEPIYASLLERQEKFMRLREADINIKAEKRVGWDKWVEEETEKLSAQIRDIEALRRKFLDQPYDGVHKLLSLDVTSGDRVQAAIAIGNLDNADNVLIHSLGMNSMVSGSLAGESSAWGTGVEDAHNVMVEGQRQLRAERQMTEEQINNSVASIVSLNYDAPKTTEAASANSPIGSGPAARNGEQLVKLIEGVQATNVKDPHIVGSGYSYGSLGMSYAARNTEVLDDVNFFGSPRLRESTAEGHNVLPGHMNVAAANWDFVTYLSEPSRVIGSQGNPATTEDFVRWSTHEYHSPDGKVYEESTGHSSYMDKETTSVHNMGSILIGNGVIVESGKE